MMRLGTSERETFAHSTVERKTLRRVNLRLTADITEMKETLWMIPLKFQDLRLRKVSESLVGSRISIAYYFLESPFSKSAEHGF